MATQRGLLSADLDELRLKYLRLVNLTAAALTWMAAMRLTSYNSHWETTWPTVVTLLAGILLSTTLRQRHFYLAALTIAFCLVTALLLEAWLVPGGATNILLPPIIVLVVGLAAPVGVATGAYAALGMAVVHTSRGESLLSALTSFSFPMLLLVTLASYVASRQFHTAFSWASSAAQRAENAARDARKRREEVVKAMQALRNAYYLIERTNHALAEAQAELLEAKRLKTEFVNTVSHELRAPLNFIVGFSELMVNSPDVYGTAPWPKGLHEDLQEIYRSSSHLAKLIDDILDLAQIEAQRMLLRKEMASLVDVAREAADMVRPWSQRKGLSLEVIFGADIPAIEMDRTRIRQVILNLLNNAVRFTERGGITMQVSRRGDEALVSVRDTGPGIPADGLQKVFEEFVQFDMGMGRPVGGSGLGLAISRRFVELHGGRIWAESAVGEGSTFYFSLPLSVQKATQTRPAGAGASYWQVLQQQGLGREVVILVGQEDALPLLARDLPDFDIHLATPDTVAALVDELRPRAIVLDNQGEGADAVQEAMATSPHDVPIICLPIRDIVESPCLQGASAHLTKPITRGKLMDVLQAVCPAAARVMVVEDDPRMRHLLTAMLESAGRGYSVETVASGEEGLMRLEEDPAHVVLLDLRLPDLSGFEVLGRMRESELLRSIPVITMSAYLNPSEELARAGESFTVSLKGRFSHGQRLTLFRTTLQETSPRFHWEALGAAPGQIVPV
ncbi:MAG: ATP-binding protein [Anaerolineae bacterium]